MGRRGRTQPSEEDQEDGERRLDEEQEEEWERAEHADQCRADGALLVCIPPAQRRGCRCAGKVKCV